MLYTIYMWAVIALMTFICSTGLIATSPFERNSRVYWFWVRIWSRGIIRLSRVRVSIHGLEKIDPSKPYIYMANHQTFFDVFSLLGCIPVPARFVAKKELFSIPIFGRAMRSGGHVYVDRSNNEKAIEGMKEAGRRIREGIPILIFPEGTRSPDHKLDKFKKGGFMLALEAGVPIVPISVVGTHPLMAKGTFRFKKSDVDIYVHKPVPVVDYSQQTREKLIFRVRQAMIDGFPEGSNEALANQGQTKPESSSSIAAA